MCALVGVLIKLFLLTNSKILRVSKSLRHYTEMSLPRMPIEGKQIAPGYIF